MPIDNRVSDLTNVVLTLEQSELDRQLEQLELNPFCLRNALIPDPQLPDVPMSTGEERKERKLFEEESDVARRCHDAMVLEEESSTTSPVSSSAEPSNPPGNSQEEESDSSRPVTSEPFVHYLL